MLLKAKINEFIKGKPMWIHNNSQVCDIKYLEAFKNKIEEIKQQYALPIYNFDNIKDILHSEIQFYINDIFSGYTTHGVKRKVYLLFMLKKRKKGLREKDLITGRADLEHKKNKQILLKT